MTRDEVRNQIDDAVRALADAIRAAEDDIDDDELLGSWVLVTSWVGTEDDGSTLRLRSPGCGYNEAQGMLHTALTMDVGR